MSYQVKHNGTDISSYVISYKRIQRICAGVGVADIVLGSHYTTTIDPYDEFEIYEEGVKKGTFFTQSISKLEPDHVINVNAQDVSKMLVDYYIAEFYEITEPSTSKYWIEFLLQQAGVSYTFLPTGEGHDMSLNTSIGNESLIDRIQILCVENGWYFLADADNNLVIGDLEIDFNNFSLAVTDTLIREFSFNKNDKMLRNRVIVRGSASPYTKIWVYGEVKAITPWNYDTLDYRTTVITAPDMPNITIASQLANQLFAETKKITEVKEVDVVGFHDAGCGDTIYINHSTFNGTGLITTISSEASNSGEHTTYLVDERCPRMFGYYRGIGDVFISTFGNGVWRKPIKYDQTWTNYSTGLVNLNVTDLSVANGILACSTNTGELYTNFPTESGWVRTFLPSAVDPDGVVYSPSDMEVNSVSVDPMTGIVRAGVNYTNPDLIPSGIRSWVAEVDYEKNIDMIPITYSGVYDLGTWDLETNDFATYIQAVKNIITFQEDLVVDPTKTGSLNTIASIQRLGTVLSSPTQLANPTQMYGQESTTEYIDNDNIDIYDISSLGTAPQQMALYGSVLYIGAGDRVYRVDLVTKTRVTKIIGTSSISLLDAIDENHCSVTVINSLSAGMKEISIDFTNLVSITYITTDITLTGMYPSNFIAKYVVDHNMKKKIIVAYRTYLTGDATQHFSLPYLLYDCETRTYTTGEIALPTFPGDPTGATYLINFTSSSGTRDIYSIPFVIQKTFSRPSPEYREHLTIIGYITAEGVEIIDTIPNEVVIEGTTLTTYGIFTPRVTKDGIVLFINAYDLASFNSDPFTATWGYTNRQIPGQGVIWENVVVRGTQEETDALVYQNDQVVRSFSKESIYGYNFAVNDTIYDLNVITPPAANRDRPNPTLAGTDLLWIDDSSGMFITTKKIGTSGFDSLWGLFLDDETTRVLSNITIPEPTIYDAEKGGVIILGGIIVYKRPHYGTYRFYYSQTITEQEGTPVNPLVNELLPLLEYKPGEPMKLLGYSASTYVNASQTRPIVLYGGDEEYNSGKFDMFDPVDLSFSNIFVSGYVSDTTTMRLLTGEGLSTCVLSCIHPSSGLTEDETTLWITDHDGVLTSGNDYGGLVIVDGGIIYTDPWHTYTMSGWYTFSGIVEHVETSNYDDQPYVFVSARKDNTNIFYQMDAKKLEDAPNFFTKRNTGIPSARITRIRVDDRI